MIRRGVAGGLVQKVQILMQSYQTVMAMFRFIMLHLAGMVGFAPVQERNSMIEEMSETGELRSRLRWVEHDLEHVVTERDKAQEKLDTIYFITNEWRRGQLTYEDALLQIRLLSRS